MKLFKNIFFLSIIFLISFLTSCKKDKNHNHNWIDATCTAPQICLICNETKGNTLEHNWVLATCTSAKVCADCNLIEGEPLEHNWILATCTSAKVCADCNLTEGEPLEHNWTPATIDSPKTCTCCGKTEGEKLPLPVIAEFKKTYISIGSSTYLNVTNYDLAEFDISFSENDIISIDEYGKVKSLNCGHVDVTLTHKNNASITTTIKIEILTKMPDAYSTLNKMTIGDITQIFIKNYNELNETSINDFNITFQGKDILTLNSDNTIIAKGYGKETIIITSKLDDRIKDEINVEVINTNDGLLIYGKDSSGVVKAGEEFPLVINESFKYKPLEWFTSDSDIAIIDDYGIVKAKTEGTVIITVYPQDNQSAKVNYYLTISDSIEVDYISRLIHTALKENGTKETGNNDQKYGIWYGNNYNPWCAMFVSWSWYHAGLSNDILLKYQGCYTGMKWCTEQGIMKFVQDYNFNEPLENGVSSFQKGTSYKPVSGDIVFFLSAGMGHTGIVIYADDTYLYTIEGNTSDQVDIKRWILDDARITGYAHPKYPEYSGQREDFSWIKDEQSDGTYLWSNVTPNQKVD